MMKNQVSQPLGSFNEVKKKNFQFFLDQNNLLNSGFQEPQEDK